MSWFAKRFDEDDSKLRFDCTVCGRGMWFPKSKHGKYVTCGGDCLQKSKELTLEKRARNCQTCGTIFHPRWTQLSKGNGLFCSQKCNVNAREAIHRPESKAKSVATMRQKIADGTWTGANCGEKNGRWNGGHQVCIQRRMKKIVAYVKRYRQANPDKVREFNRSRKDRKTGRLPIGSVNEIGRSQRWLCVVCRTSIRGKYHIDHIMPLAKGGLHVKENIQLLCPSCNVRKSAKDPIAFMQSRGFLL